MKVIRLSFLLLAGILFTAILPAQNWGLPGIKGQGSKVTKNVEIGSFNELSLQINATVYLQKGSPSVRIEAQENILDNIETAVKGNAWKIKFRQNVKSHDGVRIWISMPELQGLAVSGSGDIKGESMFAGSGKLDLAVSGSGDISLELDYPSVEAVISGSGGIKLEGKTGVCNVRISGSGDVDAFELASDDCDIRISGSGDASVRVNSNLQVSIAGSGDVYYKGNPSVRSKISGSGVSWLNSPNFS